MIKGFLSAFRTLTIIPVLDKKSDNPSGAVIWFPFVGFLIACFLTLFIRISLFLTDWYQLIAIFTVLLSALITGGIHLDGLADFFDGFGGGYDKNKILTIMKDSNIGSFGSLSLIFVILIKWIVFFKIIATHTFIIIIPAYVTSRFAMSYLAVSMPYARKEGGVAKRFVENGKTSYVIAAFIISFALNLAIAKQIGVFMLFSGFLAIFPLKALFFKRVGGITGDLLGATSEIIEIFTLICGIYLNIHTSNLVSI